MFEKLLAFRYIRTQKRHSILTVCSIMIALALMTLLFTGFSTYLGINRDIAYDQAPYHVKLMRLLPEEYDTLARNPAFKECRRVVEPNYTISAEILLRDYHDDIVKFMDSTLPDKSLYLGDNVNAELIETNEMLIELDQLDLKARYGAVQVFAIFYIFAIFLVVALRLIIDTAFEVSSKERERQFGVLQSIGATPGQIVRIITVEGLLLCVGGIPLGILLGMGLSVAVFQAILGSGLRIMFTAELADKVLHLHFSPTLIVIGAVTGLIWVLLSAYGTGMRIIRMSPIEAISGRSSKVTKIRRHTLLGLLFGWKGQLAARNNRRSPKRFLITLISLTLSVTLFASFSVIIDEISRRTEMYLKSSVGYDYDLQIDLPHDPREPFGYQAGLERVRSSDYFTIENFCTSRFGKIKDGSLCMVYYLSRETYENYFDGKPPYTYDELTQKGAYLLIRNEYQTIPEMYEKISGQDSVTVEITSIRVLTGAEYEAMSEEEQMAVMAYTPFTQNPGAARTLFYYVREPHDVTLPICGEAEQYMEEWEKQMYTELSSDISRSIILCATLDMYENGAYDIVGNSTFANDSDCVMVRLRDESQYGEALQFIRNNSDVMELAYDHFHDVQAMRTMLACIRIGCGFLSVMIGLIALVNMVNILSTGILNRKKEIAAMQCLGMTRGQLYGMTVIECLQYALIAFVLSTILAESLLWGTKVFLASIWMEELAGSLVDCTAPLIKILFACAAAFLAALAASFLPLSNMQREELADQIRCVE